jgi:hypothetical protein
MVDYGIDWVRLSMVFGIPLSVLVAVSLYFRRRRRAGTAEAGPSASRMARRGMIGMTLIGLISGALGAVSEEYLGETVPVSVLHGFCVLGLAPTRPFAWLSRALGLAAHPAWNVATLVAAVLAVPATWYLVFLGVGHLLERQRRAARAAR